jgi:pyrroloquinoline quinone biosynthesis protein E
MGGWANKMLLITPLGTALPCHAASILPGLTFPTVREQWLRWIWHESPAFQSFRGEQWMHSPCSTCPQRAQDFGGCRCQAFLLTGHAENTDPVCSLSPHHAIVEQLTDAVELQESGEAAQRFTYRQLGFPRLGGSI